MPSPIANIFVLMLENRSFDHMLGYSRIKGINAATGAPTQVDGLKGTESNTYEDQTYTVAHPAPDTMPVDPAHEFADVLKQLCGPDVAYPPGGPYPPITNSGFVAAYAKSASPEEGNAPGNFGDIMKCFSPEQLPVLNTLATEFAVCDRWFSSMPGPTWPNRFFACAASSGGLDDSPSLSEMGTWEFSFEKFSFPNGSIFDALREMSFFYGSRVFTAGEVPLVGAIKGMSPSGASVFDEFAWAVSQPSYPWLYTWIEPNYGDVSTFRGGNSQHPMDGVTAGEALIKSVYEAIRRSPHWERSLLIVTWDEHGGFYDHVAPPRAVPPGDTPLGDKFNRHHFAFDQYGVRVPAVVISPLIRRNVIDHRIYDHSSIPATIEAAFGLKPLTNRDQAARNLLPLVSLTEGRTNTPDTLPDPATPNTPSIAGQIPALDKAPDRHLPGLVHIAMQQDLALSPVAAKHDILARVRGIRTRQQAVDYVNDVKAKVNAAKPPP